MNSQVLNPITPSEMIEYANLSRRIVNNEQLSELESGRHTALGKKLYGA